MAKNVTKSKSARARSKYAATVPGKVPATPTQRTQSQTAKKAQSEQA